jgi:Pvc16 N-terminal domain
VSNPLAIATVTSTLRNLLTTGVHADPDLAGGIVTARPLDKARQANQPENQVNLFLFQTEPNQGWRNADMPGIRDNETGQPPLALDLRYLLTVWGQGDDDVLAHRILGRAMRVLHDHSVLGRVEIQNALAGNDLHAQVERIRIRPHPLSVDEMSKLWTTFQTQYRTSTAYEISVVLIDTMRPARTPLPVLTVGPNDSGLALRPDLLPPFPTLEDLLPPNAQEAIRLGETLALRGHDLDGTAVVAQFTTARLAAPITQAVAAGGTARQVSIALPNAPTVWVAGLYGVSVTVSRTGESDRTSNELPVALAPRITSITPNPAARNAQGDVTLTIGVTPQIRPEQRATLLVGSQEAQPTPPVAAPTEAVAFLVRAPGAGPKSVRLRVDGVDSILVNRAVDPPVFDPGQRVTIT